MRPDWDTYFLNIAQAVSARADCRRAQHGAVVVDDHRRIVATGYNGSPPGGPSCLAGECPRGAKTQAELAHNSPDYSDCVASHAESNAIVFASVADLRGATIYVTGEPCQGCWKSIQAAGLERVVYPGYDLEVQAMRWPYQPGAHEGA